MDNWEAIRRLARDKHEEARKLSADDTGRSLLAAAEIVSKMKLRPVSAGDPLLYGAEATLDLENQTIWYNQDLASDLVTVFAAHEFGHFWIDGSKSACKESDLDLEPTEEVTTANNDRLEGYSPYENRELQANVFAREFLLPVLNLRDWFIKEHLDAAAIATLIGVPEGFVFHQLAFALLVPSILTDETPRIASEAINELDSYQKKAAFVASGPILVEAGPGTGKTRTLVGRILHLVQSKKIPPQSILTLTFSNKAAEEMRERVAKVLPSQAHELWMGTFHAFGLEILRKYGHQIGLPSMPRVVDPVAALFLLERLLPSLGLQHYQNLFDPILPLRDILKAISRAKDELVEPFRYAELAQQMRAAADTPEEIEAAEKALEVANVYLVYQTQLESEGLVDYGDLIAKSVRLLEQFPDVRQEVRTTYQEVLVDEYQDVNRACAFLLMQIAGPGKGLWVVGDVRQSIYRFRGAAPHNMRAFNQDFPGGQTLPLLRNYRSQPKIITVLNSLAPQMLATREAPFIPWENNRPDEGGCVLMEIADNRTAEGKGLALEIERQHSGGISYRDQALLCRSHADLARVAGLLERENIPVLYLGDLFERPEIRDLLALLSLTCEGNGLGLMRVAAFPQYKISQQDALSLLSNSSEKLVPFPRALSLANEIDDISVLGKQKLTLLNSHLDNLCYGTSAWWMLVNYLFIRSDYLRPLLEDPSYRGQQRRLAVYQFLEYAQGHDQPTKNEKDPKRTFLENIRRLEILGEDKQLRQLPDAAQTIDAVRFLTVHASKGLEFSVVYLPGLSKGSFPTSRRYQPCPPPPGLATWARENEHEEEEECLFFVALSRAEDVLCLSRVAWIGGRNSNPSNLLDTISPALPRSPSGPVTWKAVDPEPISEPGNVQPPGTLPIFDKETLDIYIRCPRRYQYHVVYSLNGGGDDSAFLRFHRCLYDVLRWAENATINGKPVNQPDLLAQLETSWNLQGPTGHPFESIYRKNAEAMILNAFQKGMFSSRAIIPEQIEVPLEYGIVRFAPDHLEVREDGTRVMRRARTGRIRKDEKTDDVYGLYYAATKTVGSGNHSEIEVFSLLTGNIEPISLNDKTAATRIGHYNDALRGILENHYPASPKEDRDCPRCPYYFICRPEDEE
jgi:DNA helicase-2/ATP-dependent DNA helicase PcrA